MRPLSSGRRHRREKRSSYISRRHWRPAHKAQDKMVLTILSRNSMKAFSNSSLMKAKKRYLAPRTKYRSFCCSGNPFVSYPISSILKPAEPLPLFCHVSYPVTIPSGTQWRNDNRPASARTVGGHCPLTCRRAPCSGQGGRPRTGSSSAARDHRCRRSHRQSCR